MANKTLIKFDSSIRITAEPSLSFRERSMRTTFNATLKKLSPILDEKAKFEKLMAVNLHDDFNKMDKRLNQLRYTLDNPEGNKGLLKNEWQPKKKHKGVRFSEIEEQS